MDNLIKYFLSSLEDLKEIIPDQYKLLKPDHISIQTTDNAEYLKTVGEYDALFENKVEVPHCGRKITIGTLKEPLKAEEASISKIEIVEPKPSKLNTTFKIDHVAYVPNNYAQFIQYLKDKKLEVFDEVQLGDVLLCKFRGRNTVIEFRSSEEFAENGNGEMDKYKKEALENKEKALRALADYQNLKKRVEAEKEAIQTYANAILINKLLELKDDYFRAEEYVATETDVDKVKNGYGSVKAKLESILNDFGLEELPVMVGDNFDPHLMEAIGTVMTTVNEENDKVKIVSQKGYKLKGKEQVIRHARVIVSKFQAQNT